MDTSNPVVTKWTLVKLNELQNNSLSKQQQQQGQQQNSPKTSKTQKQHEGMQEIWVCVKA